MSVHAFPAPVTYSADERALLHATADAIALPIEFVSMSCLGGWVDQYHRCEGLWERVSPILDPLRDPAETDPVASTRGALARVLGA